MVLTGRAQRSKSREDPKIFPTAQANIVSKRALGRCDISCTPFFREITLFLMWDIVELVPNPVT